MVPVRVHHVRVGEPAAQQRHEAGRVDFAAVADEHDSFTIAHPQRCAMTAVSAIICRALRTGQGISAFLHHETPIVRGFGGLDAVGLDARVVPQFLERLFHLFGRDPLLLHAASDRE